MVVVIVFILVFWVLLGLSRLRIIVYELILKKFVIVGFELDKNRLSVVLILFNKFI